MKVNPRLLNQLRAKNINLDLTGYTKRVNEEGMFLQKKKRNQSFIMNDSDLDVSLNGQGNSNFRVRPISAAKPKTAEIDLMSTATSGFGGPASSSLQQSKVFFNNASKSTISLDKSGINTTTSTTTTSSSTLLQKSTLISPETTTNQSSVLLMTHNGSQQTLGAPPNSNGLSTPRLISTPQLSGTPKLHQLDNPLVSTTKSTVNLGFNQTLLKINVDGSNFNSNLASSGLITGRPNSSGFGMGNSTSTANLTSMAASNISFNNTLNNNNNNSSSNNLNANMNNGDRTVKEKKSLKMLNLMPLTSSMTPALGQRPSSSSSTATLRRQPQIQMQQTMTSGLNQMQQKLDLKNKLAEKPIYDTITVELLQQLSGMKAPYFHRLKKFEIRYNFGYDSLQLLGEQFSNLVDLRLSNSVIRSLRDIGTSLKNLKYLWVSRCQLKDISGINSFPKILELYANFNFIEDLSPLFYHETLELLDLEGNDISQTENLDLLETMQKLSVLNLRNNPITKIQNYREELQKKIKKLTYLDDEFIQFRSIGGRSTSKGNIKERLLNDIKNIASEASINNNTNNNNNNNNTSFNEGGQNEQIYRKVVDIFKKSQLINDNYEQLQKSVFNDATTMRDSNINFENLNQQLENEPNEDDLLVYTVKRVKNKGNNRNNMGSRESAASGGLDHEQNDKSSLEMYNPLTQDMYNNNFNHNNNNNNNNHTGREKQYVDGQSMLVDGGGGEVFYGNPLKALKNLKKKDENSEVKLFTYENPNQMDLRKSIFQLVDTYQTQDARAMKQFQEEIYSINFERGSSPKERSTVQTPTSLNSINQLRGQSQSHQSLKIQIE